MSTNRPGTLATLWRFLGSWHAPAALGSILLIGLAVWVMPVQVERVVTDTRGQTHTITAWDTSRLQAASAFWWQAALLVLGIAVVFLVTWGGRGWVVAQASAARFFACSLLAHCLLFLSLGAVPLARAVVEHAETIRVEQSAQLFDAPLAARPAYEKVADPLVDTGVAPQLVRQVPAPADVTDGADPLMPTLPMNAVRNLPPERVLFVPTRQPEVAMTAPELSRRIAFALKPAEIDLATPELPPAEAAPREKPIEDRLVTQPRREPVPPVPGGPEPLRLPELKRPRPANIRPEVPDQPRVRDSDQAMPALKGRRQPGPLALATPDEPTPKVEATSPPTGVAPADVRVTLPRLTPTPSLPGRTGDEPIGPRLPSRPTVVAKVGPRPLDATPSLGPIAKLLPRSPARMDLAIPIEEKVIPQAPFILRDKEVRERSVEANGGTKESEAAVERGLDWLAAHQNPGGSWSLQNFHANCKHPRCADVGSVTADPAGTGLALLPFLGAGHTHKTGKHRQAVARALDWLVTNQRANGTWLAPEDARPMYGHGMASIALCEAYGMTKDAKLREPAQKALDFIVKAQHAPSGGWRYQPNQPADTSVVGWQMMALKSGEMAGLTVPPKVFDGIKKWLASVEANGRFGYQSKNPSPAMTAQGLLSLQYLGARRDDPRMRAGTDYLLANLPKADDTSYYWYHATQVMYHTQGKHWKAWNGKMRDMLVSSQNTQGALAGSWKPIDYREKPGGRLYATALRLLMLEVYYRHLSLYQQLER